MGVCSASTCVPSLSVEEQDLRRTSRRFPMPVWLFERFVGPDLTTMCCWLRTHDIDLNPHPTRAIHPDAKSVEAWLRAYQAASSEARRRT